MNKIEEKSGYGDILHSLTIKNNPSFPGCSDNIEYIVADPTGNITVLVISNVAKSLRGEVAAALMKEVPGAEQVGFLVKPVGADSSGNTHSAERSPDGYRAVIRLEMAGGEFCGNASLSTAAYYAGKNGLEVGEGLEIPLEVSGADGLITCRVSRHENNLFQGSLSMPLPDKISAKTLDLEGERFTLPVVEMPGITHIIFPVLKKNEKFFFRPLSGAFGAERRSDVKARDCHSGSGDGSFGQHLSVFMNKAEAGTIPHPHSEKWQQAIIKWAKDLDTDAAGILFFDTDTMEMTPLVYVEVPGSLCYENGCGSGTAAAGAWLASINDCVTEVPIHQPGGTISVRAEMEDGSLKNLIITGNIRFRKQ